MKVKAGKKRTEQAYVLDAYKRLRKKGIPSLWEVPIMGRSADLAYLEENCLITIEFKLKDWRRGLRQARDHQIGSDFAYLTCRISKRHGTTRLLNFVKQMKSYL